MAALGCWEVGGGWAREGAPLTGWVEAGAREGVPLQGWGREGTPLEVRWEGWAREGAPLGGWGGGLSQGRGALGRLG